MSRRAARLYSFVADLSARGCYCNHEQRAAKGVWPRRCSTCEAKQIMREEAPEYGPRASFLSSLWPVAVLLGFLAVLTMIWIATHTCGFCDTSPTETAGRVNRE